MLQLHHAVCWLLSLEVMVLRAVLLGAARNAGVLMLLPTAVGMAEMLVDS